MKQPIKLRKLTLLQKLSLWSLVVMFSVFSIHVTFGLAFPAQTTPITSNHFLHLYPHTDPLFKIQVADLQDESNQHTSMRHIRLTAPASGFQAAVEIDLPTMAYRRWDVQDGIVEWDPPKGVVEEATEALDKEVIVRWMRSEGVAVDAESIRGEAEQLVALIKRVASGSSLLEAGDQLTRFNVKRLTLGGTPTARPIDFSLTEIVVWMLLWVLGSIYFCVRHGRGNSVPHAAGCSD